MAEFNFTNFFIGVILFSVVIAGLVFVLGELGGSYNVAVDTKYNETYNKIQRMENETLTISNRINKDLGTFDTFVLAGKTILSIPRIVVNSIGVVTSVITDLSKTIGIPSFMATAAITILTVLLIFFAVSLWARWKT